MITIIHFITNTSRCKYVPWGIKILKEKEPGNVIVIISFIYILMFVIVKTLFRKSFGFCTFVCFVSDKLFKISALLKFSHRKRITLHKAILFNISGLFQVYSNFIRKDIFVINQCFMRHFFELYLNRYL